MFGLILVPLDGTPFAERAVPTAIGLMRRVHGRLLLAHVFAEAPPVDAPEPEGIEAAAWEYLRDVAARIAARADVPVDHVLATGDVPHALHRLALDRDADLIVMASHDRGALARLLTGSVAERVVQETRLPVLVVRRSEAQLALEREVDPDAVADPIRVPPAPFRQLLVPLDGTPFAEAVLEPAGRVARASGAALSLVTVHRPGLARDHGGGGATREYLDRVARWLDAEGLAVAVHEVEDRHVARAILQVAIDVAADLIAMTTRKRRTVAGLPLGGGVTSEVLHAVLMPVLLVRSELGSGGG
jgi:nucleotide-binding universal stress UspA family protein